MLSNAAGLKDISIPIRVNGNYSTRKLIFFGDSLLFECNISKNILHEITNENIFLSYVLSAWSNVTHYQETQINSKTILWNGHNFEQ